MHEQTGTSQVLIGESHVGEGAEAAQINNRSATRAALQNAAEGTPKVADILAARHAPANPFFTLA